MTKKFRRFFPFTRYQYSIVLDRSLQEPVRKTKPTIKNRKTEVRLFYC